MTEPSSGHSTVIDPSAVARLAFIRMLFQQAIDQSRRPEPLNVTSVLALHDTCELFLVLAADQLGAHLPKFVPFMEYWKLLAPVKLASGVKLTSERQMSRLNELRNAFKHHGTLPSGAAIEQACGDVRTFLEANTLAIFGLGLSEIDLSDAVPQGDAKARLKAAAAAEAAEDRVEAMALLAEACRGLLEPYANSFRASYSFGPTVREEYGSPVGIETALRMVVAAIDAATGGPPPTRRDLLVTPAATPEGNVVIHFGKVADERIHDLTKTVSAMQEGLRVVALGVDYAQFERFRRLTPNVFDFGTGQRHLSYPSGYAPTREHYEECVQFVITAALRIAEVEATAAAAPWHKRTARTPGS